MITRAQYEENHNCKAHGRILNEEFLGREYTIKLKCGVCYRVWKEVYKLDHEEVIA